MEILKHLQRNTGEESRKDRKKDDSNRKYIESMKKNSQPMERRGKNPNIRRKLSYPLDTRKASLRKEETSNIEN